LQGLLASREPGSTMIVAVSGGVDSMVLLRALHGALPGKPRRLVVAHFNHQLRGRESDGDEQFVRDTARDLKLNFIAGRGDVRRLALREKLSIEEAARKARHAFLARAARKAGARTVALAHHLDDQVELFFVRLLRGASAGGLSGMEPRSRSPADARIQLWRPFLELGVTRADLESHARRHGIEFREDSSNASRGPLRNRIRHELIPLLESNYQPALRRVIARTMSQLRRTASADTADAGAWLLGHAKPFVALRPELQRAAVERQLSALGIAPTSTLIERLRARANEPVAVSGGRRVMRDESGVIADAPPPVAAGFHRGSLDLKLPQRITRKPRVVEFGGVEISTSRVAPPPPQHWRRARPQSASEGLEFFDAAKVGARVRLRHWHAGDRFQPTGMAQPVKLQDLFVNAKVPMAQRRTRLVAETAKGLLFWVEGLRISECFKLDTASRRALKWQWRRGNGEFAGVQP